MSNGDYEFLREMDMGEFKVWLGAQMHSIREKIHDHRQLIVGAYIASFTALAGIAGWALKCLMAGGA